MRHVPLKLLLVVVVIAAPVAVPTASNAAQVPPGRGSDARLAKSLRRAVNARHFDEVLDTTPPGSATAMRAARLAVDKDDPSAAQLAAAFRAPASTAAGRIHQTPNVDVAVIELDRHNRARAAADILLSPRYPDGTSVPVRANLSTSAVRWRWWDDTEWDAKHGQGSRDVLPGLQRAPIDFTSPYPASVLKLMVGFGVLRLVDKGRVSLEDAYAYRPVPVNPACGGGETKPIRQFFDEMITMSRDQSTCALIKMLHDLHAIDELNNTFARLGLATLKLTGTDAGNGGHWIGSNMTALDTAKLLMLVNGGGGVLWRAPDGTQVTNKALSPAARRFFLRTLAEQGYNEALSTTNWCGRPYPSQGIPQVAPARWIDPDTGTVTVGDAVFGQDVRPCNAAAQVTFAHKTGWVANAGSDAGIVHSLPGRPTRHYIVAMFSNLGWRYIDPDRPADPPDIHPVTYTQKIAELGRAIDGILTRRAS